MSKFDDLFKQYNCNLNDEGVRHDVEKILAAHYAENDNTEVYKQCLSQIDLTSLNGTDTNAEIIGMVNKVNHFKANFPHLPNVGAICVYPALVPIVKKHLSANIGIAAVSAGGSGIIVCRSTLGSCKCCRSQTSHCHVCTAKILNVGAGGAGAQSHLSTGTKRIRAIIGRK